MSAAWTENDVALVAPRVAHRVIDGQAVIVHPTENRILTLNPTGTAIWERLNGRTIGELVTDVVAVFEVDRETLLRDAVRFISLLADRQLVVRGPAPSHGA